MSFDWDPDHRTFADEHTWAVLATGRRDGSPQQSMVGYLVDEEGRIAISTKAYTAKWGNALRQPRVSLTVPDGRQHLVIQGTAEPIETEPRRSELTAPLFGRMFGGDPIDPESMIPTLDEQQRTVLLITPDKVTFHA